MGNVTTMIINFLLRACTVPCLLLVLVRAVCNIVTDIPILAIA